jgi:release factor glutamine methyltransferase
MTVREALTRAQARLDASPFLAGHTTARLDASLLLASALGYGDDARSRLLSNYNHSLDSRQLDRFEALLDERCGGKPVAYILGYREFYGHRFSVDARVLIPRPDTEILVEAALGALPDDGSPRRVHDLCTGSGAVAVSLAAARPSWEVSASDISPDALAVARSNSRDILGRDLDFFVSDLELALSGDFDLIVANPPYVPSSETDCLLAQGWGEPRLALDGGPDGLEPYRRLVPGVFRYLREGALFFMESDPSQAAEIRSLFRAADYQDIISIDDLAGLARVTGGRRPWKR